MTIKIPQTQSSNSRLKLEFIIEFFSSTHQVRKALAKQPGQAGGRGEPNGGCPNPVLEGGNPISGEKSSDKDLSQNESENVEGLVEKFLEEFRNRVNIASFSNQELVLAIEKMVCARSPYRDQTISLQAKLIDRVYSTIRGYDVLDEFLDDPEVTEVMVNAYDSIFIEKGGRLFQTKSHFKNKDKYMDIIQKIVSEDGKEVNQRSPICDCRMPDNSRVNIVLSPISAGDASLTIRRFRSKIYTLEELVENQTISPEICCFLKQAIQAKLNIFISGGTGSGKTTLLNALSNEIDFSERLITIEDSRELNFQNRPNWVSLETRAKTASGQGEISIRDLIRTSLRMRPDRIIVGEVRGPEAIDMLQSMNTGHDGSISTGHANSIPDMQYRLETMVISGHEGLPLEAIRQQIGAAIDLFIHLSRLPSRKRQVVDIEEVIPGQGKLNFHPIFKKNFDSPDDKPAEFQGEPLIRKEKFSRQGISLSWMDQLSGPG